MDVNTEKLTYKHSTPIKNSEGNITENTTNGYLSEDTNCTANSSELFSDNENENINENDLICYTPNVSKTETSFLNISETSLLDINKLFRTPSEEKPAVIPSTLLSLLPFISKINEQWTSDLETPQMNTSFPTKSSESIEQTVYFQEYTRNNSYFKNIFDEFTLKSTVINYTKMRRRIKRKIYKNTIANMNVVKIFISF
ncbi:uncharacterized protein LOC122525664 [Polistes fuscatus]|uniref:uncharacterized protein LOC122525664 n=1 Tax=Polistes fuscatus TaxID=30207 RepID=UPI001CA837EE|nr:uncharacterized protein LOC122525664 [Polistes fuscatus]XP_043504524.1 uncharacterized protein LOC122525664 [Polistes fuscatus]